MFDQRAYEREYYNKNKEKINERRKQRYTENEVAREKAIAAAKKWNAEHPGAQAESKARAKARGYKSPMSAEQISVARENTRQWRKENKATITGYQNARRQMMREAKVGRISRKALWNECGGICAWCGDPIDESLRYPDLMSLSYDHKIPLSKGGMHQQDNVQCVHLVCNIKKRDSSCPSPLTQI